MIPSLRLIGIFVVFGLLGGCQVTNTHDPANTYTPETTYQKLVDEYPFDNQQIYFPVFQ